NLLIYLDSALQKKIMPLFHFALNPEGLLLLGSSETAGPDIDLFAPLPGKSRLYQRLPNSRPLELAGFPFGLRSGHPEKPRASSEAVAAPSLQSLADQLLLSQFSPAAVLVTGDGDIVYISGKTGQYLEPAAGRANWNIFAMCHKGLDSAL